MSLSEFDARPQRLFFVDVATAERWEARVNPERLQAQVAVVYNKLVTPGLSHTHRQYSHTEDLSIFLELLFVAADAAELASNGEARRFLLSLCYPVGDGVAVPVGGPPRVLVFWPNLFSLTTQVQDYKEAHSRFDSSGNPLEWRATLELAAVRDFRLSSAEVRRVGTLLV